MVHGRERAALRILRKHGEIHDPEKIVSPFRDEVQAAGEVLADAVERRARDVIRSGDVQTERAFRNAQGVRRSIAEELRGRALEGRAGPLETHQASGASRGTRASSRI